MMPLVDLLLLAGFWLAGAAGARYLLGGRNSLLCAALGVPLGTGMWSWGQFLLSLAGITLSTNTMLLSLLALLIITLTLEIRRIRETQGKVEQEGDAVSGGWAVAAGAFVVGAFTALAIVAIRRSFSSWDAMAIWGIKGYAIAAEGTIFAAREWGSHGLSYPLNLPLQIGAFRQISGDLLPASKMLFPAFFASLSLGALSYFRGRGINPLLAAAASMLLVSTPIVLEHATIAYANLPFAVYLLLAVFSLSQTSQENSTGPAVLAGLLLALAAWTRPEGMFVLPVLLLLVGLVSWLADRRTSWIALLSPVVLVAGPWLGFSLRFGVSGIFSSALSRAIPSLLELNLNPAGVVRLLRFLGAQYLDLEQWGLAIPVALLLAAAGARAHGLNDFGGNLMAALALASGGSVLAFYYFLSFRPDFSYWLGTGLERLMMPSSLAFIMWLLTIGLRERKGSRSTASGGAPRGE